MPVLMSHTKTITVAVEMAISACSRIKARIWSSVPGSMPPVSEHPVAPLTGGVDAVPGDAGGVLHDGQPPAAQLIEEHGLAHIGPAHDGN